MPKLSKNQQNQLSENGFLLIQKPLPIELLEQLKQHAEEFFEKSKKGYTAGLRNLLRDSDLIQEVATTSILAQVAEEILGENTNPVRAILFDKTPETNWSVPWHQDTNILARNKVEHEGFGPYTMKEGVLHVVPPPRVLEQMVTLRLHLDACGTENGPLWVVPGSHRAGIVKQSTLQIESLNSRSVECVAAEGDVLIMKPLLLHSSKKAIAPHRRRVLHLEFSAAKLSVEIALH